MSNAIFRACFLYELKLANKAVEACRMICAAFGKERRIKSGSKCYLLESIEEPKSEKSVVVSNEYIKLAVEQKSIQNVRMTFLKI